MPDLHDWQADEVEGVRRQMLRERSGREGASAGSSRGNF
jgi:hypothetical protein